MANVLIFLQAISSKFEWGDLGKSIICKMLKNVKNIFSSELILILLHMNFIRTNIISKILAFLFALHIFNISVDPPDAQPEWIPKDLSINEMNSITEIFFEEVLHIDNAFPEFDQHDNRDHGVPIGMHLDMMFYYHPITQIVLLENPKPLHIKQNENFIEQFSADILIPPPKA